MGSDESSSVGGLKGARVALLEGRMSGELANIVRHYNGEPYSVPALREEPVEDNREEVNFFLDHLIEGSVEVVIFLTGVGATALFREAEERDRLPQLRQALQRMTSVCRGPKPTAALRKQNLAASVVVPEPYTTKETLETLAAMNLKGKGVAIVHYGERSVAIRDALRQQGAQLMELCLYEWSLPEDTEPLKRLVKEIIGGEIDAVAFTTQVQVRHLFQIASELGLAEQLAHGLTERTIVAAVGPTTAGALRSYGVTPRVVPEHPKMGPMISRLAAYIGGEQLGFKRNLAVPL